jgi:phage terminase large subunit GpA-like protein
MTTLEDVRLKARASLIPPPRLVLSEWIEKNIRIPEGVSSTPGPVRLWPYQREIADAIGDPDVERVSIVKCVRVGFTTLLTSAMASFVANEPAPILSLLPTEDDCRDYIVSDIEPIFDASPTLTGLLNGSTKEGGRDTIQSRRFPGGSLKVVAAKSPRNLRRHNVRILLIDEADGMEDSKEGDPVTLIEKRTFSFANRKIVIGSTPVFEETSRVLRAYRQSDQSVFECPCPHCGDYIEIKWQHIQWPEGEPIKAAFCCPSCGGVTEERGKSAMVRKGRWRATAPHVIGHRGFRLNALVSVMANASWGKLAVEFVAAKSDPSTLQTFTNTILGEGWREDGEDIDDMALAGQVEPFGLEAMPEEVMAITAGCDVQHDRLETTLMGWSPVGTMFVLGHSVIYGAWDAESTWTALNELLTTRWKHPYGGTLGVDAAAIDSGDGLTMERVYSFAFPRARNKVMAIKGDGGVRPRIVRSKQKIKGGFLWIVGVDGIKTDLIARVKNPKLIRFSQDLDANWFEQLAGERRVIRYTKGRPKAEFIPVSGRRHEALDCAIYGIAARQVLQINFIEREQDLRRPEIKRAPRLRKSVSSLMER